ncbi:hypothetical protein [Vitreimonas flagellata]|uniref:hypothetical protein n=1 Tax=Vitreimonas flagellata TaxID=2560861 RepID=UPI00143009ED|nr:hypothetical protein [Vitreimonas flagellata]
MIPPAECQRDPPALQAYNPGPLPPASQELAHARAVADSTISYADEVRTQYEDVRLVGVRCAEFNRRTAEEQQARYRGGRDVQ